MADPTYDAYEQAKALLVQTSKQVLPSTDTGEATAAALLAAAHAIMYTGDMTLSVAVSMDKIARQLERLNELMEMRVNQEAA